MNQTEYGLAYGLVIGLIFLGLLTVCIPRPRKRDIAENLQKELDQKRVNAGKQNRNLTKPIASKNKH